MDMQGEPVEDKVLWRSVVRLTLPQGGRLVNAGLERGVGAVLFYSPAARRCCSAGLMLVFPRSAASVKTLAAASLS
jgi:hypothetical protein